MLVCLFVVVSIPKKGMCVYVCVSVFMCVSVSMCLCAFVCVCVCVINNTVVSVMVNCPSEVLFVD